MVTKIDHLGILVEDIDAAKPVFEFLDLEIGAVEHIPGFGVEIAFIRVGESLIELVEPVEDESSIAADLDAVDNDALLHHVAFRVDDIQVQLDLLHAADIPLADTEPRTGAGGSKVAFLAQSASNGVRIELVERKSEVTFG